ncbi:hypothetical protein L581_2224 [Serratia fonticola AU-AP2C]|nr:hypothetical protein L581_2224 [Serratia fonticola AU-AP2C]
MILNDAAQLPVNATNENTKQAAAISMIFTSSISALKFGIMLASVDTEISCPYLVFCGA